MHGAGILADCTNPPADLDCSQTAGKALDRVDGGEHRGRPTGYRWTLARCAPTVTIYAVSPRARGKGVGVDIRRLHKYGFFPQTSSDFRFANLKNLFNKFYKQLLHF